MPKSSARPTKKSIRREIRCAVVLLKCFLGDAVEADRGDRSFQARSGNAPCAMRTAPAGYGFTFRPDHAPVTHRGHYSELCAVRLQLCYWGLHDVAE